MSVAGRGGGAEVDAALDAALAALARRGCDEVEVYAKRGRSRRLERGPFTVANSFHEERGWAVRAGDRRSSFFAAGTGTVPADGPWPDGDGRPLRLPDPVDEPASAARWSEPSDFETPLVGEAEGGRVLTAIADELDSGAPGARLDAAVLEDGSSESEIVNQRGVRARWRRRVAVLHLEATAADGGRVSLDLAEREARRFNPRALARRLIDGLAVATAGTPAGFTGRDRGELVLAPAVAARVLAGLLPLLVGPEAAPRIAPLRDRRGRVASPAVTVVDDGRLPGGALVGGCDGEGLPTRRVVLVEAGRFRQPLLAWDEAGGRDGVALGPTPSGCRRRASWRDLPHTAPSHLHLVAGDAAPGDLVADLARGYYLLDAPAAATLDLAAGRFHLPVRGFAVERGRAVAPIAGVTLVADLGALLQGIQAVARDLAFFPLDGMIGSPSLRVSGLELRGHG